MAGAPRVKQAVGARLTLMAQTREEWLRDKLEPEVTPSEGVFQYHRNTKCVEKLQDFQEGAERQERQGHRGTE